MQPPRLIRSAQQSLERLQLLRPFQEVLGVPVRDRAMHELNAPAGVTDTAGELLTESAREVLGALDPVEGGSGVLALDRQVDLLLECPQDRLQARFGRDVLSEERPARHPPADRHPRGLRGDDPCADVPRRRREIGRRRELAGQQPREHVDPHRIGHPEGEPLLAECAQHLVDQPLAVCRRKRSADRRERGRAIARIDEGLPCELDRALGVRFASPHGSHCRERLAALARVLQLAGRLPHEPRKLARSLGIPGVAQQAREHGA